MEDKKVFREYWTERGKIVANGGLLTKSDLLAIYANLRLDIMKPEYIPGESTLMGTAIKRKKEIFVLAKKLWGLSPEGWLIMERYKLKDAREVTKSKKTGGKEKEDDVISAELLIRIVATAKLVFDNKNIPEVVDEALNALNLTIAEACSKGRARMVMVDGKSIYSILKHGGLMIGTGGGKYLPYPEEALPFLFRSLQRGDIETEAYFE